MGIKNKRSTSSCSDISIEKCKTPCSECRKGHKKKRKVLRKKSLKPCDVNRPYLQSFLDDLWSYLTPDIIDSLKELLMKEFGMKTREAEEFLLNQRMKTMFKESSKHIQKSIPSPPKSAEFPSTVCPPDFTFPTLNLSSLQDIPWPLPCPPLDLLCSPNNLGPPCPPNDLSCSPPPCRPCPQFCYPPPPPYPCCTSPEESYSECRKNKRKKLKKKKIPGLRYYWVKELTNVLSIKLNDYVAIMLSRRRSKRVRCISEIILKHLCDITGEVCTLNSARTRAQKIMVFVADRIAIWLAKISCICDASLRETCGNKKENGAGDNGDDNGDDGKPNEKQRNKARENKKAPSKGSPARKGENETDEERNSPPSQNRGKQNKSEEKQPLKMQEEKSAKYPAKPLPKKSSLPPAVMPGQLSSKPLRKSSNKLTSKPTSVITTAPNKTLVFFSKTDFKTPAKLYSPPKTLSKTLSGKDPNIRNWSSKNAGKQLGNQEIQIKDKVSTKGLTESSLRHESQKAESNEKKELTIREEMDKIKEKASTEEEKYVEEIFNGVLAQINGKTSAAANQRAEEIAIVLNEQLEKEIAQSNGKFKERIVQVQNKMSKSIGIWIDKLVTEAEREYLIKISPDRKKRSIVFQTNRDRLEEDMAIFRTKRAPRDLKYETVRDVGHKNYTGDPGECDLYNKPVDEASLVADLMKSWNNFNSDVLGHAQKWDGWIGSTGSEELDKVDEVRKWQNDAQRHADRWKENRLLLKENAQMWRTKIQKTVTPKSEMII